MKKAVKVILPAAGFASRMGFPEAKEILINPQTGIEFIEFSLVQATKLQADVVVITRPEKKILLSWLEKRALSYPQKISIQLTGPTQEWPETVLKSQEMWGDFNWLILPDTDWTPVNALIDSLNEVRKKNPEVVYFTFPSSGQSWGFIKGQNNGNQIQLCEKPVELLSGFEAWGIIGFQKESGKELFTKHLQSTLDHQVKTLNVKYQLFSLQSFNDRTRGVSF